MEWLIIKSFRRPSLVLMLLINQGEVENAKISTMRRNALRSRRLVNVRIKLLRNV